MGLIGNNGQLKTIIDDIEIVDGYTKKIDNLASNGLLGVSDSVAYRIHELEQHSHVAERWFGVAIIPNGTIHHENNS